MIDIPIPRIFPVVISDGGNVINVLFQKGSCLREVCSTLGREFRKGRENLWHGAKRRVSLEELIQALLNNGALTVEFAGVKVEPTLYFLLNRNFSACLCGDHTLLRAQRAVDLGNDILLVRLVAVKL